MSRIGIGKHWSAAAAGRFPGCLYAVLIGFFAIGSPQARAADHIRVATLKTGTLAWELEVVRAHGLGTQCELFVTLGSFAPDLRQHAVVARSLPRGHLDVVALEILYSTAQVQSEIEHPLLVVALRSKLSKHFSG